MDCWANLLIIGLRQGSLYNQMGIATLIDFATVGFTNQVWLSPVVTTVVPDEAGSTISVTTSQD